MNITPAHVRNGAFLTLTALALGGELWAAFDSSPATRPWTDYLTELPWWLLVPMVLAFVVWLPLHLIEFKVLKMRARSAEFDANAHRTMAESLRTALNRAQGTEVKIKPDSANTRYEQVQQVLGGSDEHTG